MRGDGLGLARWVAKGASDGPGSVLGVVNSGRPTYEAAGQARLPDQPLTVDTIFYVASLAKQFTAAVVALLIRDGALRAQDSVRRWLPEFPVWADDVTIDHCVHHTGGLPDGPDPAVVPGCATAGPWPGWDTDDIVNAIAVGKPMSRPGDRYRYGSGPTLLAEIIRRATGMPLAAVAQERIFGPLGMADTFFRERPTHLPPKCADGYWRAADGTWTTGPSDFHAVGDGGLWTTVPDLVKWDANLSLDVLSSGWLPAKLVERGVLNDGTTIHYAWGLSVRTHRGANTVSHGGSGPGFQAKFLRFPDKDLSIIWLANHMDADLNELTLSLADELLDGQLDPDAPPATETFGPTEVAAGSASDAGTRSTRRDLRGGV